MINFTLQEYKVQREFRDQKRKQYITQFQTIRKKMGLSNLGQQTISIVSQQAPVQSHIQQAQQPRQIQQQQNQQINSSNNNSEHSQLLAQNVQLKQQLSQIETTQKQKLQAYKSKINTAKNEYMQKIKQVNEESLKNKANISQQIEKLEEQINTANNKNIEIEQFNSKLDEQTRRGQEIMTKYSRQIQQQYDQKLEQFNNVYEASTTKIQEMENEQNDQEFVKATLENEQIVQSIKQNAENSETDIEKMLTDYTELLNGKQQITQQLFENNKMKEQEIAKMTTLEEKLKDIFGKINEEKRLYGEQNARMGAELLEVKQLLTKTLGGAGGIA